LPDAPRPTSISLRTVFRDTPRHLFGPSPFRTYVWLAVICAVLATPIPPFAAYYLKVGPSLSTGQIMLFEVLRYLGVMVAAWVIRRRIDATGARPFFLLAVGLYAAIGVFWWFYLENGFGGIPGICGAYFLLGLSAATWAIASLNYLPKIVTAEERTLVVSVHGAVTACIGGVSPVIWGVFLKSGDGASRGINEDVFQWFFVSVVVGACALSSMLGRLHEPKGQSVEPILIGNAILRPFRAMTYLVNLVELRPPAKSATAEMPKDERI
jgi:hypothetical protein